MNTKQGVKGYTPGPWNVLKGENFCSVVSKSGKYIVSEVTEANADLIASAPALLEACKLALKAVKFTETKAIVAIQQAIAQAEGGV